MPNSPEAGFDPESQNTPNAYFILWNSIRETPREQFDSDFLLSMVKQQGKTLTHERALAYLNEFALILEKYHDYDREEIVLDTLNYLKKEK